MVKNDLGKLNENHRKSLISSLIINILLNIIGKMWNGWAAPVEEGKTIKEDRTHKKVLWPNLK